MTDDLDPDVLAEALRLAEAVVASPAVQAAIRRGAGPRGALLAYRGRPRDKWLTVDGERVEIAREDAPTPRGRYLETPDGPATETAEPGSVEAYERLMFERGGGLARQETPDGRDALGPPTQRWCRGRPKRRSPRQWTGQPTDGTEV